MSTNKLKKEWNRRLISSAMLVVALLLMIMSASFSWLYQSSSVKVSGVTMEVAPAHNLLIKAGESDWTRMVTMPFEDGFEALPVIGNGTHFYYAQMGLSENTGDYVPQAYLPIDKDVLHEWGVYEFDFSLTVESALPVCLSKTSSVTPLNPDVLDGIYGDYSAGHIGAALRIAVLQKVEDQYVTKMIWIPNATTKLITVGGTQVIDNKSGEDVEEQYLFVGGAAGGAVKTVQVNPESAASGVYEEDGVLYAWGDLEEDLPFATLKGFSEQDFKIVIWLDGNDRECHNALMGGEVSIKLGFVIESSTEDFETE